MDYDKIVINLEANFANATKQVDSFENSLKKLEGSASGQSLKDVNRKLAETRTELRASGLEANTTANALRQIGSIFGGTFGKVSSLLANAIQQQERYRNSSEVTALERERNAIREAMAQQTVTTATKNGAQASREAAAAEQQRAQVAQKAMSDAISGIIDEGASRQDLIDIMNQQGEAFDKVKEAANQAVEESQKGLESLNESAGQITTSLNGASSGVQQVGASASGAAPGINIFATATKGLTAAVKSLYAALGPLLPILIAIAAAIAAITIAVKAIQKAFELAKKIIEKAIEVAKGLISAFKKVASAVQSAASRIADATKQFFGLDSATKNATKSTNTFSKLFQKAWNVLQIKVLRNAINALFSKAQEGFRQLAVESEVFNNTMSSGVSAVRGLSNSLVAALAPALNAVMPLVVALARALQTLFNAIAALTAALFGQATYFKANDVWENYAAGVNGATGSIKKLKDAMNRLPFDELNTISDTATGGGGGGGGGAGDWFTEVETPSIFDLDVREWMRNLIESLNNIDWDTIQQNAARIGRQLASIINDAVDEALMSDTPGIFGTTVAQALNTGLHLAYNFIDELDFGKLGQLFGININTAIRDFDWALLGKTISGIVNGIWEFWLNTIKQIDFYEFGQSLGTLLNESIGKIDFVQIANTFVEIFKAAINTLKGLIGTFNIQDFAMNLAEGINTFVRDTPWDEVAKTLTDVITWAIDGLATFLRTLNGGDIARALITFFENIGWDDIRKSLYGLLDGAWTVIQEFFAEFGVELLSFREIATNVAAGLNLVLEIIELLSYAVEAFLLVALGPLNFALLGVHDGFSSFRSGIDNVQEGMRGLAQELVQKAKPALEEVDEATEGVRRTLKTVEDQTVTAGQEVTSYASQADIAFREARDNARLYADELEASTEEAYTTWGDWIDATNKKDEEVTNEVANRNRETAVSVADNFTAGYSDAVDAASSAEKDIVGDFIPSIDTNTANLTENISDNFSETFGDITDEYADLAPFFDNEVISPISDGISDLEQQTMDAIRTVFNGFTNAGKEIASFTNDLFSSILDGFKRFGNGLIATANSLFSGLVHGVNEVTRAINTISIDVPDWVPDYGGRNYKPSNPTYNYGSIPSLRVGMSYVPANDFMANLHLGEAVLTREEADLWRGLGGYDGLAGIAQNSQYHAGLINHSPDPFIADIGGFTGESVNFSGDGSLSSGLAGMLYNAVNSAIQANANIIESGDIYIADEQIYRAAESGKRKRGARLGGDFANEY